GGSGGSIVPTSDLGRSDQYAGVCDVDTQKLWVRSYLDETYLWYDEIKEVNRGAYTSAPDYFNALLVRTPDAGGQPRDRFSAALPIAQAQAILSQSFTRIQAFTDGNLLKDHTNAVPVAKVVESPDGRRTGYIRFDDFESGAQDDMITAVRELRDDGIDDLVLDMRANSGGFLYIAQAVASMVAGPSAEGKVFEQLRYNDKRDALSASSTFTFSSRLQFAETQYPANARLPQLDLPRVYILSSNLTCSSSESLINGLRGIDVEVVLVGDTTCGKPYGFQRRDNCGYAYFPIEFKGANAKGFGDYASGFQPTCRVADDGSVTAGSTSDPLLSAALFHVDNGTCPASSASALRSSAAPGVAPAGPVRPAWAGRLLRPQ
ncbi:MAG: hypothetical protein EOO24_26175, partial [Comamonadaceae bacterium]